MKSIEEQKKEMAKAIKRKKLKDEIQSLIKQYRKEWKQYKLGLTKSNTIKKLYQKEYPLYIKKRLKVLIMDNTRGFCLEKIITR